MREETKRRMSQAALERVSERFRALSEPMRLRLIYALMDGERNVTELVRETGGVQANVSRHLSVLLDVGVLARRKQGTSAYYRIADESIFDLCELVCNSIEEHLLDELHEIGAPRRT